MASYATFKALKCISVDIALLLWFTPERRHQVKLPSSIEFVYLPFYGFFSPRPERGTFLEEGGLFNLLVRGEIPNLKGVGVPSFCWNYKYEEVAFYQELWAYRRRQLQGLEMFTTFFIQLAIGLKERVASQLTQNISL